MVDEEQEPKSDGFANKEEFLTVLMNFMKEKNSPIESIPKFDHKELDLYQFVSSFLFSSFFHFLCKQTLFECD